MDFISLADYNLGLGDKGVSLKKQENKPRV